MNINTPVTFKYTIRKIVGKCLKKLIDKYKLLNDISFGFREIVRTENVLWRVTERILHNLDAVEI